MVNTVSYSEGAWLGKKENSNKSKVVLISSVMFRYNVTQNQKILSMGKYRQVESV